MAPVVSPALLRSRKKKARDQLQAGQWEAAQKLLTEICAADSRDAEARFLLGAVAGQRGDYDAAIRHARQALSVWPDFADAWYNLAQACMHVRRLPEAVDAYRAYLRLNPGHADAHNALGLALDSLGRHNESVRCFQEATRLKPGLADAWHNAGNAVLAFGNYDGGIRYLQHAIFLRPDYLKSHVSLGFAYATKSMFEEAAGAFARARAIDPSHADPEFGLAYICERRGQFDAAWEILRPYYESGCREEHFLIVFAKVARHVGLQSEAAALLEQALNEGAIAPVDASAAHFTLGTIYDALHDYDCAFPHFMLANAPKQIAGGPDTHLADMERARATFTREFFAHAPRAACDSARPLFIVGMPRSGTTLTEQILASHPLVAGGGELTDINTVGDWLAGQVTLDAAFPARATTADIEKLNVAARRYLDRLASISADARHVTDKMPHNFVRLGLIALLFPNAHIVHCHRHPMDNCLSIFTFDFNVTHAYAADLSRLGQHYRGYRRMMTHWREHLPLPIFDLRYEDMVADQEKTSRALLAFCGLPWDAQCLRFHEHKRAVNTFSYDQVRRPLYSKSVERWRHYERFLGPLIAALGPDAEPLH